MLKSIFFKKNGRLQKESYIKKTFNKEYLNVIKNTSFLDETASFQERVWCIKNNKQEKPKCKVCEKILKYQISISRYQIYCNVKCRSKDKEVKEKQKNTMIARFGVEHNMKSEESKNKRKVVWLEKYGVDHPSKTAKYQDKRRKLFIEKYGADHPSKTKKWKENHSEKLKKYYDNNKRKVLEKCFWKIVDRLPKHIIPLFSKEDYEGVSGYRKYKFICSFCHTEFMSYLDDGNSPICKKCNPVIRSKGEKEIYDFIRENYNGNIILNSRDIISPLELDIYLPDLNLAIEYNGNYWHSDLKNNDRNYHLDKTNKCEKLGVQLIHIFEIEWKNKTEIIKSIILNKLNKSEKIFARKCVIKEIKDYKNFLNNNHIQGYIASSLCYGLHFEDELVMIMSFGKSRYNKKYDWELYRVSTKLGYTVIGGPSKLLNHFFKNNKGSIISYCNRRFSEGNLYNNLGFFFKGLSKPNYWYIGDDCLESRIKYQKGKLKKLLKNFDPNLSEFENMKGMEGQKYGIVEIKFMFIINLYTFLHTKIVI